MLWSTLFNRLGKLPLRITQHNHIKAIIEGKNYQLDMKFDAKGQPYLVPMQSKVKKPYSKIYWYIVAKEVPEILGSGSQTDWEHRCDTESEAFEYLKAHNGNTLYRKVKTADGKRIVTHWYDFIDQCWKHDNEPLPY